MINAEVILLDIEGTTSPIDFVYKTLFPFARERLENFLDSNSQDKELIEDLIKLRNEYEIDQNPEKITNYSDLSYLESLMDQDKKSASLKSIQGKIWEEGFRSGKLKGELFPDVAPALERWRSSGYKCYIYSSGSVLAQKLLFQFSVNGNLTCFLYGHFDTAVGAKTEPSSYKSIAEKIYTEPNKILFISDAPKELDAAKTAGLQILFSNRPGNIHLNTDGYPEVYDFDGI